MTTNIRKYVDVIVSRATRPIDTANFNIPLFLTETNLFDADERVRSYNSIDEMTGDGWSPTSAAVKFATNVFSGTFRPQQVLIGKQSFTRFEISVLPGSVEYFLTIIAVGVAPQTITFTGTELTSQEAVVDGLVAAITVNTNLTGVVTAANVNDNLEITPQGNNIVTVTGLSANLQGNINQFTIDTTSDVGAQTYSAMVEGSARSFTSDTTPTLPEVRAGALGSLSTGVRNTDDPSLSGTNIDQLIFGEALGSNEFTLLSSVVADTVSILSETDVQITTDNLSTEYSGSILVEYTSTNPGDQGISLGVNGVSPKPFVFDGSPAANLSQVHVDAINSDTDLSGRLTAHVISPSRYIVVPAEGTTLVVDSSVDQVAVAFGFHKITISTESATFSFSVNVDGTPTVVSTTSGPFQEESAVLTALGAEVAANPGLSAVITANVSSGQLVLSPAEGVSVTITNLSNNLASSFDKFVVTPATGGDGVRYAFTLEATSASVSQTIEYTSDNSPTTSEILQGLSDQINNSGIFNTALVAGVTGSVLSITPNINQDVSISSLTGNLSNTVVGSETALEALAAAAGENDSWFFLSAEDKAPATQLALGRYAQANDRMYITTVPASTVASTADDDIASQMRDAQLDNTHTLTLPDSRMDEQAEGGVIGAIASINPGESILAFKSMPGVSVTEFSSTEQNRIQGKNSNIYPLVNGVAIYDNGVNQSGLFFDDVRFGLWMKARIAEAVFGLLKRESDLGRKVTFGQTGFEQIRQTIYGQVLQVGIRRNAILTSIDGVANPLVRIPARSEIPTNDIANRTLRDVVVEFTYSGAIQQVSARVFILI